ncbi:MAG: hypothetical protein A2X12_11180 [Bacteroidetes bacterium GWE2_29_8]|nr:MAG: hypothetical protein A2X12_11180 [Bacteroidetes bacterium GWE2_29_8]OFY22342.1 MAG: hypothetical protein A2X02_07660 [Bacteroidetes bacterium GWF2_29_10]
MELYNSDLFAWVILPLLIFFSRICDVSIGTIRVIFVAKGFKLLAPLLGFFEVIIWLIAVSQIMQHLDNIMSYIAYGGGFAAGNYIGIILEEKISIGNVVMRIIPKKNTDALIKTLREHGYGLTLVDAEGAMGTKFKMIFMVIQRQSVNDVIVTINSHNPNAFYSIEDVKAVSDGYINNKVIRKKYNVFDFTRKGK